jgi:predicted nucleic acid-binding protein
VKVIDSSSLIKYVSKEENWRKVEEYIKEGCITFDLAVKETANALVKKTLKSEMDLETAKEILNCVPRIVKITSQKEHLPKALEIAVKNQLPIYDALFMALSVNTNTPLLTSDMKQAETSKEYGITVILV